jgi:hypothetical protein
MTSNGHWRIVEVVKKNKAISARDRDVVETYLCEKGRFVDMSR